MRIALLDYHKNDKNVKESEKIQKRLITAGADAVDIYRILKSELPNVCGYDNFVLSGSDTYNLLDRHDAKKSLNIVKEANSLGKKVLAFCGGFELLVVVGYGLKFEELEQGECGFFERELTAEGEKDSLFRKIPKKYSVLEVHKRFIKGDNRGGILSAYKSGNSEFVEAIKFGENIYGMQGHPEDTFEEAEKVIEKYGKNNGSIILGMTKSFLLNENNLIFENFINNL